MNWKSCCLVVILSLFGGLIGGVVSNQYLAGRPLFFSQLTAHHKVLTAEKFRLVDKNGTVHAALGFTQKDQPGLGMLDKSGKLRIVLGIDRNNQPSLKMWDPKEKEVWSAP